MSTFGKVLKSARIDKNVTQANLAKEAGLDRTYISLLERGEREPSLSTVFELAHALGIHASDFVLRMEAIRKSKRLSWIRKKSYS